MKKSISDLAWRGTTAKEKKELLDKVISLSSKQDKDYFLNIGSTCIDIMGTIDAVKKTSAYNKEWKELEKRTKKTIKDVLVKMDGNITQDWSPSDYEVMGSITRISFSDFSNLNKALKYFQSGANRAKELNEPKMEALLLAKIIETELSLDDAEKAKSELSEIVKISEKIDDPKVSTRLYRSIAKSAKFLAIDIAKKAKLKNQILKAEEI